MLVLNAFLAISEGLVSNNQSSPLPPPPHPLFRDLPLRSHLVLLLVRSHHPVKNIWLFFCLKVKTEQQNQSRSLQNDTGIQNTAKVVALQKWGRGGGGGGKGFRWAKLTEKESTLDLWFFFFFIFSCLCSLTVLPFLMLFSLTTEPDPRLHRPFHIGIFLPSWAKQVVFLEKYSGWTCCIAFQW